MKESKKKIKIDKFYQRHGPQWIIIASDIPAWRPERAERILPAFFFDRIDFVTIPKRTGAIWHKE